MYEAPFAHIKVEHQRWPEIPLIFESLEPSMLPW